MEPQTEKTPEKAKAKPKGNGASIPAAALKQAIDMTGMERYRVLTVLATHPAKSVAEIRSGTDALEAWEGKDWNWTELQMEGFALKRYMEEHSVTLTRTQAESIRDQIKTAIETGPELIIGRALLSVSDKIDTFLDAK